MSMYVCLRGQEPSFLSSNRGWWEFKDWSNRIDAPEVHHLVDHSWSQQLDLLSAQLRAARLEKPPRDDVLATVDLILDTIGQGGEGSILVTDGIGAEQ